MGKRQFLAPDGPYPHGDYHKIGARIVVILGRLYISPFSYPYQRPIHQIYDRRVKNHPSGYGQGTHCKGNQGKQGKWPKKIPVRENTGNLEILPKHRENTGNFVFPSFKFPENKGKRYFDICRFLSLPSQFCVCNSHKSRQLAEGKFAVGQGKNRDNREFENAI